MTSFLLDHAAMLHRVLSSEVDKILGLLGQLGIEPNIATAARDIVELLNSPSASTLDHDYPRTNDRALSDRIAPVGNILGNSTYAGPAKYS